MDSINIKGSLHTPSVDFNAETGELEMCGRSIPEETLNFFNPLINWVKDYSQEPQPITTLNLKIEYLNSGSHTSLLVILKKLEELHNSDKGVKVTVIWYYEEDDEYMLEAGEEYAEMLDVPFKYISVVEFEVEEEN